MAALGDPAASGVSTPADDPFSWIAEGSARTVARIAGGVALVLIVLIQALTPALMTDAAPFGIVSLQLATSQAAAARIVASWEGGALAVATFSHGLDTVLPFAYALGIGAAARVRGLRSPAAVPAARLAAWSVLVAAATDLVENVAMAVTLLVGASWASVIVTLAAAVPKWTSLALAVGALAVASLRARR
jgi:hypothetical protein